MTPSELIELQINREAYESYLDYKKPEGFPKKYEDLSEDQLLYLEENGFEDYFNDAEYEFRGGEKETNIDPENYSRHFEASSVAAKIDDKWVGWTYWYGGGKHAEPEAIEWKGDAYFLDVKEVMVKQLMFAKVENDGGAKRLTHQDTIITMNAPTVVKIIM